MAKDKDRVRLWFIIPVLIGITLFVIGVIFILSGVFIKQPLMNSENWFNLENTKLSRIYLGVFVGSVGLLVIGLMTPTYFFVDSRKEKQRISNTQMEKLTFFGVGEKAPTFSNISQEKVVALEEEITDSRDKKEKDTPQIEEQPIKKTKKKEILKETPLYDDDDIEIIEKDNQSQNEEESFYNDDDIEIIESPVQDEDKQEKSFYDDDDIEILENTANNEETEDVPPYNDDDIEIIDKPTKDKPIDDAPIYNDDDIEILD